MNGKSTFLSNIWQWLRRVKNKYRPIVHIHIPIGLSRIDLDISEQLIDLNQ